MSNELLLTQINDVEENEAGKELLTGLQQLLASVQGKLCEERVNAIKWNNLVMALGQYKGESVSKRPNSGISKKIDLHRSLYHIYLS